MKNAIIEYLNSMQTEESIELKNQYDYISKTEGMYGTRPAIHVFTFDIEYQGERFSARGCHFYSYPNFEKKYGVIESITELDLREYGHKGTITSFVFKKDKWVELYKNILLK